MLVTLSRQMGSGGDMIAARVAAALGLLLVDREYIYRTALKAGVPDDLLHRLMYEGQRSLAGQLLDSLVGTPSVLARGAAPVTSPLGGIFSLPLLPASINLEESVRTIGLIIKDVASQGHVLVLGQGGQAWLRDYQGACHVQIVAPLDVRAARVAERERVALAQARRLVRASDLARADYVARYHGVRWLDPTLYHLVINTGYTSADTAVALIVHAAQAVGQTT